MDLIIANTEQGLLSKRESLKRLQNIFRIYIDNNINDYSFEQNAISRLEEMMILKTEINQLEMLKQMIDISERNGE